MTASLGRLVLYTKDMDKTSTFYETLFGFVPRHIPGDRIIELSPAQGGAALMLHPAARSQEQGQAQLKLVFDVPDVTAFCTRAADLGYPFGKEHAADGYSFANIKDPSGNSVQVSSRAFRT